MTISRKYRSYGIRRLNNFSDLNNAEQSLDNLLNNLQEDPERSFISRDLDAIRGLKDTEVFPATFIGFAATAPTYTFANTLGPQVDFIEPIIRIQDRINTYRSITGAPGKQGAGYGPEAWTVPDDVFKASPVKGDTVNDIVPNFSMDRSDLIYRGDFWAVGEVFINSTFDPSFTNGWGGIVWESFYIPDYTSTSNALRFTTTGLFHVEFDRFDTGDWVVYKSIYAPERSVRVVANNDTSTTVELLPGDEKYVAQGDKLSSNNDIQIVDVVGSTLTLSEPITVTANDVISFEFIVGEDLITDGFEIEPVFDIGEKTKIRMLWWYPNTAPEPTDRYLFVGRNEGIMPFSNFSNTDIYPTTGPYELQSLLSNAVTAYQPKFGDNGAYKIFRTDGVLRNTYTPPTSFASINKYGANTSTVAQFVENRRYMIGSATRMAETEVGNIIVDATPSFSVVSKNTRIKRNPNDNPFTNARIITSPANATANVSIRAIDHNGLADYFITSSSGTTITVDSTANLRPGMVCITHFTSPTTYSRITEITNATTFQVSSPLGISSNNYVFVYADSGIIDASKDVYCQGVVGKLLTATANEGVNVLTLDSTTGLTLGMRVQYTGGIEPSGNYTISNIAGNQVTLNNVITSTIDVGATIVFSPSGSTGDKQQCVIPLDLSPPFIGTSYGLDSGGRRIVGVPTANLNISVLALSSNTSIVTTANTTDVFSAFININGTHQIKARKVI